MNEYSRKMLKVPTYNLLREQDKDKLPVLDVRNLGIDFGGLTAVDSFNITIGPTEISGLIGPNGAGKTTIFNLLTSVYQPTRGSILINGIDTKGMTTHKVNKLGIARTFQNIRLFSDMTALENVKVGMHNQIKCSFVSSLLHLPGYYKAEKKANEKAMALVRPGVRLCDVDAAARDHIAAAGYGEYFTHRLGHFIGMEDHEQGDVSAVNPAPAEEGMVFSIEPGVYLPGEFGVRVEDLVIVTADGCESLNHVDKQWKILGI